jgi:hypothetical protein
LGVVPSNVLPRAGSADTPRLRERPRQIGDADQRNLLPDHHRLRLISDISATLVNRSARRSRREQKRQNDGQAWECVTTL